MFDVIILAFVCILIIVFIIRFKQYNRTQDIKNKYVFEVRFKIKEAFDISTIKESRDIAYAMAKLSNMMEMSDNITIIKSCYQKINMLYLQVLKIEQYRISGTRS